MSIWFSPTVEHDCLCLCFTKTTTPTLRTTEGINILLLLPPVLCTLLTSAPTGPHPEPADPRPDPGSVHIRSRVEPENKHSPFYTCRSNMGSKKTTDERGDVMRNRI